MVLVCIYVNEQVALHRLSFEKRDYRPDGGGKSAEKHGRIFFQINCLSFLDLIEDRDPHTHAQLFNLIPFIIFIMHRQSL